MRNSRLQCLLLNKPIFILIFTLESAASIVFGSQLQVFDGDSLSLQRSHVVFYLLHCLIEMEFARA
jgi:hypothetical protein